MSTINQVGVGLSGSSGSGSFAGTTSPSFTTPSLGVATATTVNKVTLTQPASGSTLTIADGKTVTESNTLTYQGTDGSTVNFGAGGTVAYGNSISWSAVSGTTQAASINNGYVCQNASATTVTLPTTAPVGSIVAVQGQGSAGFVLTAGAGQTIKAMSSTTTTAGSLTSATQYDSIEVVCVVANTTWAARFITSPGMTVS